MPARPSRSIIRVKSRPIAVERKPIRTKWQTHRKIASWRAAQPVRVPPMQTDLPERPILAEVERCLAHRPMQFPQKLWGEVL